MRSVVNSIEIGDVCLCQRDYYRALEHYFPVLRVCEKTYALNHPDTASLYYSIGTAYDKLHRGGAALSYYHKALAIWKKVLGQNHPDTAMVYKNMAHIYSRLRYVYWYWRCDDDLSYLLSEIQSLFSFDDICFDHYTIAMDYYQKALGYYESSVPADDASLQEIHEAIKAMVAKKEEENNLTLDNYYKVMEISERLYGADSIRMAEILYYPLAELEKREKISK